MKKNLLCKFILLFVIIQIYTSFFSHLNAQNVAVTDEESYVPAISAMLDVKSTNKGLLIPRLTTEQRLLVPSPVNGLMVYDTDFNSFFYHNGTTWTIIPKVNTTVGIGVALFAVVNLNGDTIFAVYNDGVKVTVPEGSKGTVGGFAVSGRTPGKADPEEFNYFRVTADSTRIYINDTASTKGSVGGFAVSGRTPAKSSNSNYFLSTPDSTRIYVNDTSLTKGTVGGFAVSGRTPGKGTSVNYMDITPKNYFIGHSSGINTTTGLYNSFFGYQTGMANTGGGYNSFIGYNAGKSNTTGEQNVFIGNETGFSNDEGKGNVFVGNRAGYSNTYGRTNVFIGFLSGETNISGRNNVFIGSNSGYLNQAGEDNTFIGNLAGYANTASFNSFIGYRAGRYNTSGSYNSFMGHNAGFSNTVGSSNVFIGDSAGFSNTDGIENVMIGKNAGLNSNGNDNIFIGLKAGQSTIGDDNIFIGMRAGMNFTSGICNMFIGTNAGFNHTNQNYNLMIGTGAGYSLNSIGSNGSYNSFLGINAGNKIQNSKENAFIGTNAGAMLENGWSNTIVGICAAEGGAWDPTEYHGYYTERNTIIGCKAGRNIDVGSDNIFIGYMAGAGLTNVSNKLYIGSAPLIYGDFSLGLIGLGTTTPAYKLDVVGDINITGNFKVNGVNIVTSTIVEGDLTATGPISLSATRKVIGGAATISIANASISTKGAVQLSSAYDKFSEEYATTELALSSGLATKVTGAGITMGQINLLGNGEIVSIAGGHFVIFWDLANENILINNVKSKAAVLFCWWQSQVGGNTDGETKILEPAKAGGNVIIPVVVDLGGYEIHISDPDGLFSCSLWIQRIGDRLVGHYTQF